MKLRWLSRAILVVLAVLSVDLTFFVRSVLSHTESRARSRLPKRVDLIAVLTGGQGRLREAFDLLQTGRGDMLLVSGVAPGVGREDVLRANGVQLDLGFWNSRVVFDDQSTTTLENAREVVQRAKDFRAQSILLVTSSYHVPRALVLVKSEWRRRNNEVQPLQLYALGVESSNFLSDRWWKEFSSLELLAVEYVKLWAARFS